MATGEGKTLAAAIAAYGHVRLRPRPGPRDHRQRLPGQARRRPGWRRSTSCSGSRVGLGDRGVHAGRAARRRTPATSPTCRSTRPGFDYLRDQLVTDIDDRVQPALATAIVDEADSILIDEARVPMVLAGSDRQRAGPGARRRRAWSAAWWRGGDYEVADGRPHASPLTDEGPGQRSRRSSAASTCTTTSTWPSCPRSTWRCTPTRCCERDVDYIVRDGAVELIDEMRGRVAQRRRWPDGLHAAVEAKEGLDASAEGEVLGTITVQAYVGALPDAVRHDRDRGARRRPAARVLQARGRGDPVEHAVHPRGRARPHLRHPGREGRGDDRRDHASATSRAGRC